MNLWGAASSALFLLSLLVYGFGIYLWETRSIVCGDYFGLNVALTGSGVAVVAGVAIAIRGYFASSRRLFAHSLLTIAFAGVMYFFVGVLAVGCSGI